MIVCPICGGTDLEIIRYDKAEYINGLSRELPEVQNHTKNHCRNCKHLFSDWLDIEVNKVAEYYQGIYSSKQLYEENTRAIYQYSLMTYTIKKLGKEPVSILDFGCGPNSRAAITIKKSGIDAKCCDILDGYQYGGDCFYKHVPSNKQWEEHLGNTIEAWKEFNRMLKPGGIMAHCFPTQIHYRMNHEYFATPFHPCIFSGESLLLLLEQTGFVLESIEDFVADVPKVFLFRKEHNV